MDVVVNSCVQSPLMRTLEPVSTKSGALTYNIPDNMPPLSFSRIPVEISGSLASESALGGSMKFKIPQHGYLMKMDLMVTETWPTTAMGEAERTKFNGEHWLARMIKSVELTTRNRPLERFYSRELIARMSRDGGKALYQSALLDATTGAQAKNVFSATRANVSGDMPTSAVSFLTIPLSSTLSPGHNYNTRFVEPLEVSVDLETVSITGAGNDILFESGVTATPAATAREFKLICHFVNYHDLSDQDIRQANYQPDAPAVVFGRDTVEEQKSYDSTTTIKHSINANQLTYGMTIMAETTGALKGTFADIESVTLNGSGQVLYDATMAENACVDQWHHNLSTLNSAELSNPLQMLHRFNEDDLVSGSAATEPYRQHTAGGREGVALYIPFSLSRAETYNSGAVGLQTVANPQLTVKLKSSGSGILYVYLHHHALFQIDSGTGAVTRSMDA